MEDKEEFRKKVIVENVRLSKEILKIIENDQSKKNNKKDKGEERYE